MAARPDDCSARYNLARAMEESRDIEGAINQYNTLLASQREHKKALERLGAIHKQASNWSEAFHYLNRAGTLGNTAAQADADWIKILHGAHVEWFSVDMKRTDSGQFKILEMGEGLCSGFGGYNEAHLNPMSQITDTMNHKVATTLRDLLPIPLHYESGGDLMWYPFLKQAVVPPAQEVPIFDITSLRSYSKVFNKSFGVQLGSDHLVMGSAVGLVMAATSKNIMDHLRAECGDDSLFPLTRSYPKDKAQQVAQQILSDWRGHAKVVLKQPDLDGGVGVHVVPLQLDAIVRTLRTCFSTSMETVDKRLLTTVNEMQRIAQSFSSRSSTFLVQEYIDTPIAVDRQKVDVTIRASVIFIRDQGQVSAHVVDAFYRLPPPDSGSSVVGQRSSVKLMTPDELQSVQRYFSDPLTLRFFQRAMAYDMRAHIDSNPKTGKRGDIQLTAMAILSSTGFYATAIDMAEQAVANSEHYRFFKAKTSYLKGDFNTAIRELSALINDTPLQEAHRTLAKCWARLGNWKLAAQEIQRACKYGQSAMLGQEMQYIRSVQEGTPIKFL